MDCCFDSGVMWDTRDSSPVTVWLKKSSPCSLHQVSKVNSLACHFILCSSVNNFGTQREHNFQNKVFQTQFREEVTVKFVENAERVTKW
jgi:hypothetical protein